MTVICFLSACVAAFFVLLLNHPNIRFFTTLYFWKCFTLIMAKTNISCTCFWYPTPLSCLDFALMVVYISVAWILDERWQRIMHICSSHLLYCLRHLFSPLTYVNIFTSYLHSGQFEPLRRWMDHKGRAGGWQGPPLFNGPWTLYQVLWRRRC